MFVLISSFVQGSHNLKYFSRCTSSQIVVCTEESANRIVQNKKSSFSNIIPLKATLMPSSFEKAIMDNDHKHVKRELDQRQPVPANSANAGLQTGLMIACQHSSVQTVKVFLEKSTPVKHDDPSLCNVNLVDASGWTALHYAAKSGSLECVKLLLEHTADINAITNENETALFMATKHNHLNVVKLLATSNCQLQTKAGSGKITALELAVTENLVEIATCLLFHLTRTKELHKEELNQLLVKAAEKGHTKIAYELLINGANVNNHEGIHLSFSLSRAANNGHLSMVKFLLSKGAELEDMLLFETDHLPIIKYLLKKGAKATATDSHGDSLLHKHCKSGNLKNAKFLVRHYKAEVSAKNEKGQTPLHLACKNGNNLKMVKFFIERNHSDLAFLSEENLKMVKFLIEEQKADPTFTCDEGKTALHYAAEGIDLGIFKYLIEDQKLDIEAIDNEGRTPLHLAAQNEFLIDLVWPTLKYMIEKHQKIIEAFDNSKRAALQYCLESYKRKKEFIEKFKPIAAILVAKAKILETKESKNTDHIFDWIKKAYNSKFRTEDDEAVSCLVSGLGSFQKQVDSKDGTYRQFNPLLYVACYCNRLDIAGYMFRQDIGYIDKNINAAGENLKRNLLLRSYMRFSCKEGFLDLTRFLLQELSNNQESFGQLRFQGEFLKTACRYKQINVFKYLLEDEKAKDEAAEFLKYFPLHYACAKGSLEMVQYLIETNKADVESKDKEDQTPLQCALCCGSIKIVKYLIEGKNAFFDTSIAHRKKLFQVLCNSESLELFKYINTTFKLDVNAQDENGFTALHSACKQYRNLKVAKFLITDMKANLQSLDEEGRTPLHVACQSKFPKVQISKLLVNQGANVLAKDNTGKTPLQSVRSPYHLSKFLITFLRAATKRVARYSCIRCQDPIPNQDERFNCQQCSKRYSFDYCKKCNESSKHKHQPMETVHPSCAPTSPESDEEWSSEDDNDDQENFKPMLTEFIDDDQENE